MVFNSAQVYMYDLLCIVNYKSIIKSQDNFFDFVIKQQTQEPVNFFSPVETITNVIFNSAQVYIVFYVL